MNSILASLILLAPGLQAPVPPQAPQVPGEQDLPRAPEAVRKFFLQRIQDRVGLGDAQAQKVVDRWQRYFREHVDRQQQIAQLRRRFEDILLGPGNEDQKNARIKPLLEQFLDLRRQQAESKQRFEEDIRAGLSPAQQARLVMTVEEIIHQMQRALENRPMLRGMRRNGSEEEGGRPRRRFQ